MRRRTARLLWMAAAAVLLDLCTGCTDDPLGAPLEDSCAYSCERLSSCDLDSSRCPTRTERNDDGSVTWYPEGRYDQCVEQCVTGQAVGADWCPHCVGDGCHQK